MRVRDGANLMVRCWGLRIGLAVGVKVKFKVKVKSLPFVENRGRYAVELAHVRAHFVPALERFLGGKQVLP